MPFYNVDVRILVDSYTVGCITREAAMGNVNCSEAAHKVRMSPIAEGPDELAQVILIYIELIQLKYVSFCVCNKEIN